MSASSPVCAHCAVGGETAYLHRPPKSRTQFLSVLLAQIREGNLGTEGNVLVVGGSQGDAEALLNAGFSRLTLSNLGSALDPGIPVNPSMEQVLAVDAEEIAFSSDSFDIVFAHEVLHHCRSPHKAVCEMLRVARHYVLFLEPNDSALMGLLRWLKLSFPFELAAVMANGCVKGGVRDSQVPNFIYRWNAHEVHKTVASFLAERMFAVRTYPYWDFNADEYDLSLRKHTRIGALMRLVGGPGNFLRVLRLFQGVLNRTPFLRQQGNKFFCCIEKRPELRPWLAWKDGSVVFNQDFR